jgi:hypothetical protein
VHRGDRRIAGRVPEQHPARERVGLDVGEPGVDRVGDPVFRRGLSRQVLAPGLASSAKCRSSSRL